MYLKSAHEAMATHSPPDEAATASAGCCSADLWTGRRRESRNDCFRSVEALAGCSMIVMLARLLASSLSLPWKPDKTVASAFKMPWIKRVVGQCRHHKGLGSLEEGYKSNI